MLLVLILRAFLIYNLSFKIVSNTFVRMRVGGISTLGMKSNWIASKDMYRALSSNNMNSYGLVLLRLPLKLLSLFYYKFRLFIFRLFNS